MTKKDKRKTKATGSPKPGPGGSRPLPTGPPKR
jgi:hypothetical protein